MLILINEFYGCLERYVYGYRDANAFVWRRRESGFLNSIAVLQCNRPDTIYVDCT
jgi:hypothetical protein